MRSPCDVAFIVSHSSPLYRIASHRGWCYVVSNSIVSAIARRPMLSYRIVSAGSGMAPVPYRIGSSSPLHLIVAYRSKQGNENDRFFNFWVCHFNPPGSGRRWWALLRIPLYNQVLGRGLMGSRVDPGPPLARSRVNILAKYGQIFVIYAKYSFGGRNTTPLRGTPLN